MEQDGPSDDDDGGDQQDDGDDDGEHGRQFDIPFPVLEGLGIRTRQFFKDLVSTVAHGSPLLSQTFVVAL